MSLRNNRSRHCVCVAGLVMAKNIHSIARSAAVTLLAFVLTAALTDSASSAGPRREPAGRRAVVVEAKKRLAELGYMPGKVDGTLDASTRSALSALQRVEGLDPTGQLTPETVAALESAVPPTPLESGYRHVE